MSWFVDGHGDAHWFSDKPEPKPPEPDPPPPPDKDAALFRAIRQVQEKSS